MPCTSMVVSQTSIAVWNGLAHVILSQSKQLWMSIAGELPCLNTLASDLNVHVEDNATAQ